MGIGAALPAIVQTGIEAGASGQNQLMQLLGLLRLDQGTPERAQALRDIGERTETRGNEIWGPALDRMGARAEQASNWWQDSGPGYTQGMRNAFETVRDQTRNAVQKSERDANYTRNVARAGTLESMRRADEAMNRFDSDRAMTLDALQNQTAREVQSIRVANDKIADKAISDGLQELQTNGLSDDPVARMEMKERVRGEYADQIGARVGEAQARYQNKLADTHLGLTATRAQLGTESMRTVQSAYQNEIGANVEITNIIGNLRQTGARTEFEAFAQTQAASERVAMMLNGIDQEAAAIEYQNFANNTNIQLGAEALLTQSLFAGAGMLYNWNISVPNLAGNMASMGVGQSGGGGGGGGGSGFSGGVSASYSPIFGPSFGGNVGAG